MGLRRALGWVVVGAALLPLPALLDPAVAGSAGASTREVSLALLRQGWMESGVVVVIAALVAVLVTRRAGSFDRLTTEVRTAIGTPSAPAWAALCGALALMGAVGVAHLILAHEPLLVDEMVQLRHARLLAEGRVTESWPHDAAFRDVQNGLWTPNGWSSIYPPGHTALLALGVRLGGVVWTGPLLAAMAAFFWALALLRLLHDRPVVARVAALVSAVSPLVWGLSAGYLSHPAALAFASVALWAALRARGGGARWSVLAGMAGGMAVLVRPLTGGVLGVVVPALVLAGAAIPGDVTSSEAAPPRRRIPRLVGWIVGGSPAALLLAGWNRHLHGSPLRFGYEAAFGPAHGLGFHLDPWGNRYGPLEALAYTGADLIQLGRGLLETPFSPVVAVGLWLALARRRPRGSGLLLAWAGLPVVAHLFYWHHGIHLGPRMLMESAPAWIALAVVAVAWATDGRHPPLVRRFAAGGTAVAVAWAIAVGIPGRLGSWSALTQEVTAPPEPAPALVFVHGSWASRVAGHLAATGMRRDSIETALRRNDLCRVHEYAMARRAGSPTLPALELTPLPGPGAGLTPVTLSPGNRAWIDMARDPTSGCYREARSDARGVTPLARVLAEASPPSPDAPTIWVRDLGPDFNAALLQAHPDRTPWLWGTGEGWMTYEAGMRRLWSGGAEPQD